MDEWEELDKIIQAKKKAIARGKTEEERLTQIADEFITSKVEPAFTELRRELEKRGKRVQRPNIIVSNPPMASITVSEGDVEEIDFDISAEATDKGIKVTEHVSYGSQSFESSFGPTELMSAEEIKKLTKRNIIDAFLERYKEAID